MLAKRALQPNACLRILRGGIVGDPSHPTSELYQPIDVIAISDLGKTDFSADIVENYQKGFSLKEVAQKLNCSKHKVLNTLRKNGVDPRPKHAVSTHQAAVSGKRGGRKPYFGFRYVDGAIKKHPVEFSVLKRIHQLWTQGMSAHHIVGELNKRKIKSRESCEWSWAAVRGILSRFESGILKLHGQRFEFTQSKEENREL